MRSKLKLGFCLFISIVPQLIVAGLAPLGGEYAMLGDVSGHQQRPGLVMGADGGFVVWQNAVAGVDGERVMIQRLGTDMTGVGGAVRVGGVVAGNEERPRVAMMLDGGCVVVWESGARASRDVYVRFVNDDGTFRGGEVVANTFGAGIQEDPAVAVLSDGSVVVVWSSVGQDGSGAGVYGQRFTAAGVKVGGEFSVNQTTARNQMDPAVCAAGEGFVVGWVGETVSGVTGVGAPNLRGNIWGRVFDKDGNAAGNEYKMNGGDGLCSEPVLGAGVGGFVLGWVQQDEGNLKNLSDIYARKFNAQGIPAGNDAKINTYLTGRQDSVQVISLDDDAIIVWASYGQDASGGSVHGRLLSGGREFQVNTQGQLAQKTPGIADNGAGSLVVVWSNTIRPDHSILSSQRYLTDELTGDGAIDVTDGAVVYTGNEAVKRKTSPGVAAEALKIAAQRAADEQAFAAWQAAQNAAGLLSAAVLRTGTSAGAEAISVAAKPSSGGVAVPAPAAAITASTRATTASPRTAMLAQQAMAAAARERAMAARPTAPVVRMALKASAPVINRVGTAPSPNSSVAAARTSMNTAGTSRAAAPPPIIRSTATAATAASRVSTVRTATGTSTVLARAANGMPVSASIASDESGHRLQWLSDSRYSYQVQGSSDRTTWGNVGAVRGGLDAGDSVSVNTSTGNKFYRVVRTN